MPNTVSQHQALAQLWSEHVRKDRGKGERVQESLHPAGGPTGYFCSTTVSYVFQPVVWSL
jgi:hypothetical protein